MFSNDDMIRTALEQPDQVWNVLDSFWRDEVGIDTRDLVQYQSWAALLAQLTNRALASHCIRAQSIQTVEPLLTIPWYPIVLYHDLLTERGTFALYGEGYVYSDPPEIVYGEESAVPVFLLPTAKPFRSITSICDAVTDTRIVLDHSQFDFDPQTGVITFQVDPFALIPAKTDTNGREYIVLWLRNPSFDLDVPFNQIGWTVKYDRVSIESYAASLRYIWELVLLGPSTTRYQLGLLAAMGFPIAVRDSYVQRIETDGDRTLVITDSDVYAVPPGTSAVVAPGDQLQPGDRITDGVTFASYTDTLTLPADLLPALALTIPLSSGAQVQLTFANIETEWTYDPARPSVFRFPVGGSDTDIEAFWQDVQDRLVAAGLDLAVIYSLSIPMVPGPTGDAINPMRGMITDLMQGSVSVASVDLATMPLKPGGFFDRARLLLPADTLLVLNQIVGTFAELYDLETATLDTVSYGYNVDAGVEVISIPGSGTDLTYVDHNPLVVTL